MACPHDQVIIVKVVAVDINEKPGANHLISFLALKFIFLLMKNNFSANLIYTQLTRMAPYIRMAQCSQQCISRSFIIVCSLKIDINRTLSSFAPMNPIYTRHAHL